MAAIVGRPNVGKSTLFNALTGTRDAIVSDQPGVTRDRHYGVCRPEDGEGGPCVLIDTGGIGEPDVAIAEQVGAQSLAAIDEADLVLFVIEASGPTPADHDIAGMLRRRGKCVRLLVNKADGVDASLALSEAATLGFAEPRLLSARSGRGVPGLRAELTAIAGGQQDHDAATEDPDLIRVAIVGRPNVGKSTLVNRLCGEERVLAYDQPGTTRDAIDVRLERDGERFLLIDTAGLRRKARVREEVERLSALKALRAIERCQVVVLLLDAAEGPGEQDASIVGHVLEAGKALVVALNKWDGLARHQRTTARQAAERLLDFVPWAPQVPISARHGSGLGELLTQIRRAQRNALREFSSHELTEAVQAAVAAHAPPQVRGHAPKLRYAHQGGRNPLRVILHGSRLESLPQSYLRYLENFLRRRWRLAGTPIRFEVKSGSNPYAGKRNELTERQLRRRRRLIRHVRG